MGLDMYLFAKRRIYPKYDDEVLEQATKIRETFPEIFESGNLNTLEIGFEAGYWRKANQIHKWFVDNVQDGNDNCLPHYVTRKDLEELKRLCKEVLETKNTELLPPQSGFFFGSTEVDEYYWEDLEETIKIIDKCLELPEDWSFEYHSSW